MSDSYTADEIMGMLRQAWNDRDTALAEGTRLREATEELVKEANRIAPQLPYNAPTASLAAAIDKARAALIQQSQAGGGE